MASTRAAKKPKCDDKFKVAVVDLRDPDAALRFTDSLKSTGFAVLTNHPVPSDLITGVYSEWRDFMIKLHTAAAASRRSDAASSPTNLADKYYHKRSTQDGYFPMAVSEQAKGAKVKDLKHYFQLYFPHGQYPRDEVSTAAEDLFGELIGLGKTLVQWIDDHMPPEIRATIQEKIGEGRTLSECISDERTMLRVLHYPGYAQDTQEQGAVRAAAHEDINLITVLPAGSARGLQVLSKQSGEWYEVPLVEGSIIINIGDMMQEMSDHAYISTTHRVIKMDEDKPKSVASGEDSDGSVDLFGMHDRMSTPCFIHLKRKCPLSEAYGSAEHYLLERLVTLGVKPRTELDEFLKQYPGGVMPLWDPAVE